MASDGTPERANPKSAELIAADNDVRLTHPKREDENDSGLLGSTVSGKPIDPPSTANDYPPCCCHANHDDIPAEPEFGFDAIKGTPRTASCCGVKFRMLDRFREALEEIRYSIPERYSSTTDAYVAMLRCAENALQVQEASHGE